MEISNPKLKIFIALLWGLYTKSTRNFANFLRVGFLFLGEAMAKRMTDSNKWDDAWFSELSIDAKVFWLYLLDKCDHAGIWKVNFRLSNFCTGLNLSKSKILKELNGRVFVLDDEKWFIPKFIEFQYGALRKNNKCHDSVVKLLKPFNLLDENNKTIKPLTSPSLGVKDKDKDKDKDKEKEKDKNIELRKNIIDYLNQVTDSKFKHETPKTISMLNNLIAQDFSLQDFKRVIANKYSEWGGKPNMAPYLKPTTLFSGKFNGYAEEKEIETKESNEAKLLEALGGKRDD